MRYTLTLFILLFSVFSFAQKKKTTDPFVRPLPVPHKAVNDFGKFLSASERTTLEIELANYQATSGNAIVFISLDSLTDPKTKKQYTIEEAAFLYFNTWGIGDSIKNNGVLLMVSRSPRRVRIEIGRGLETILTNSKCQTIIDDRLVPNFKKGLFFTGIKEAVTDLRSLLDNPPAAATEQPGTTDYTVINESSNVVTKRSSAIFGFSGTFFVITIGLMIFFMVRAIIIEVSKRSSGMGNRSSSNSNRQNNNFIASDDSHLHDSRNNSGWSSGNDNASSSFSSPSMDSSPSSSPSSDTSSGGSSDGGGASGSY